MAINHKEFSRSLSVIVENPKKIAEAENKYKATLAEIQEKERKGDWSPNAIKRMKDEAIAERNRVCHTLAHGMREALEIVKRNNDLKSESLDINSPKVQNAVNILSLMGKRLSAADQASMLESFRGDVASLRFLESAFEKNNLPYAAKAAREMYKGISEQALSDMETVLDFHDYSESKGQYSFPIEKATWTRSEFERMRDRMGYEPSNADPFLAAIDDAANAFASETTDMNAQNFYKYLAQQAKAEVYRDGKNGADVLNRLVQDMELKASKMAEANSEA